MIAQSCDGPDDRSARKKTGLFHAGHNIIDASLDHAATAYGLDKASTILISGGSAGGQGAYYHADWLTAKYPKKRVLSAPVRSQAIKKVYDRTLSCSEIGCGVIPGVRLVWGAFLYLRGLVAGQEDGPIHPLPVAREQRLRASVGPQRQALPRSGLRSDGERPLRLRVRPERRQGHRHANHGLEQRV